MENNYKLYKAVLSNSSGNPIICWKTLEYEKPKVVVFNVPSMKYNEPQKEAYNRLTLEHMKLSKHKIGAIKASMMDNEDLITYIFPF